MPSFAMSTITPDHDKASWIFSNRFPHLSQMAVSTITNIVNDPKGPFASMKEIDWVNIYKNTSELTPRQMFKKYISALSSSDRVVFDQYIVKKLKQAGLIQSRFQTVMLDEDIEDICTSSFVSDTHDLLVYYVPVTNGVCDESQPMNVQDLYMHYQYIFLYDDFFINQYAKAICRSISKPKSKDEVKPFTFLLVREMQNGNFLVANKPA